MTPHELAAQLNGREYLNEITKGEEESARRDGHVVVFGYSDDNTEFRGAVCDEVGAYNGANHFVHPTKGLLQGHDGVCDCQYCGYESLLKQSSKVEAVWHDGENDYSWTFKTSIPHATFDIMEDGKKFCRGIVFRLADAGKGEQP